ncbi:AAA family ATPase [Mycobacterium sp. IDR2000157661]|nr:AAA family ATPase [Mycobacterium sp. IDR2000157661]
MALGVIERPAEYRAVTDVLSAAMSRPAAVVIEGEAGVGKTTLWLAGVSEARDRGFRVLSARSGEAETAFAYAAVADLLYDVEPALLTDLPDLQRLAVDRVLLRADGEGPPTDQGVVAAALAAVIELLAARSPVLVALDDVQWLDPSSQAVVAAAAKRLTGRVGMLLTERTEHEGPGAAQWLQPGGGGEEIGRIRVGPLSLGALHALISARLGRSFSRPTMVRIRDISGGNPFYALELARTIEAGASEAVLPATLAELMRRRIGRLDSGTQTLLLAAACAAAPTPDLLARVTDTTVERVVERLGEAEAKGIITIEGGPEGGIVCFTHPLLARSVYTDAMRHERRAMHRSLAEAVELPELRARHMALAASSADPTTLKALDTAADTARTRGAPAAGAELIELAIGLGGDTSKRRIRAAEYHLQAGDLGRARRLLDGLLGRLGPGSDRARALILLAQKRIHHNDFGEAVRLLEESLENALHSAELRIHTLLWLSCAQLNAGDLLAALQNAERAVTQAEDVDDPNLISHALGLRASVAFMCGRGVDLVSLRRAVALEDPNSDAPFTFRASANSALLLSWSGRLDEACKQLTDERRRCVDRGAETDVLFVALFMVITEIWRGEYVEAARIAEEMKERAQQLGGEHMQVLAMTVKTVVASYAGREEETRSTAVAAIERAHRCGSPRLTEWAVISVGFLEVSLGRHEQALQALQPLLDVFGFIPGTEIVTAGYIPDAVEAMIALGRAAEAEPLIEALETNGRMVDRPWMLATGARCRSLWLAARGQVTTAAEMAEQALVHHERLPMPFERARTLLVLGQLRRRQRQKETARATLAEALEVFETLGASLWADRARAELDRVGLSSTDEWGLTPSEQRVAELAATGMTTRDVASALFISPKTVESNLAKVYRKLGIRSRAELGRVMSEG